MEQELAYHRGAVMHYEDRYQEVYQNENKYTRDESEILAAHYDRMIKFGKARIDALQRGASKVLIGM